MSIQHTLVTGIIFISRLFYASPALAQQPLDTIEVTNFHLSKDKEIIITYDLEVSEPGLRYRVVPYYEDRNGQQHLITEYVRGSWGDTITAGKQKKIFWNHYPALRRGYQGGLPIGISVEVVPPSASLLLDQATFKRGTRIPLPLRGSVSYQYHVIDTNRISYHQGTLKSTNPKAKIPTGLDVKNSYQIWVEDSQGNTAYTTPFTVKRRFPLVAKIGVPVIAAAVITYIFTREEPPLPQPYGFPPE